MDKIYAWSLVLSALVLLSSIGPLTYGRYKAGYSLKNMSAPRAMFDKLPDFGKRAVWCHQNCWESFALHAPSCILCLVAGVDSSLGYFAALIHPLIRVVYIISYVTNVPIARGLSWASGLLCSIILYKQGLDLIINY